MCGTIPKRRNLDQTEHEMRLLGSLLLSCALVAGGCSGGGACFEGESRCGAACVNLQADPANCGVCSNACGAEQVCSLGTCQDGCGAGLERCDRSCVDLARDPRNCGACGKSCPSGSSCQNASCVGPAPDGGVPADLGGDAAPPVCQNRVALQTSGAYDVDLKVVTVSGRVTKNGQPVPEGARGRITFQHADGNERRMASLPSSGEAVYQGELFAGSYDVYYEPPSSCSEAGPLPCQRARLKTKLAITTNGTLDLDLKIVTASGRVTRNGDAVASGSYRGAIAFALEQGSERRMPSFAASGEATYQGELFAGTYDVYYQHASSCSEAGPLPCQRALLKSKLSITTNGTLDLDLKIVAVSGRVTKNGAVVPEGSFRGAIAFALEKGSERRMPSFGSSGEATYQGEIFAGTHDVYYQHASSCSEAGPLPCQRALLKSKLAISTNGTLDLDLKIVAVSGRVTKNGAAVPEGSYRGAIAFALEQGSERRMPSFGSSGEATYQGEIFAGTHDVYYQHASSCSEAGPLPCQRALLKGKLAISTNGTLDLDLKIVAVSGRVTKNGKAVPEGSYRGALGFAIEKGSERRMPSLPASGEASYQGEIFAGSYDIRYLHSSSCSEGGPLPCQTLLLAGCPAAPTTP